MKTCTKCGAAKPESDFYRRLDGLQPLCKVCSSAYNKAYNTDATRWPPKTCAECGEQFPAGPPSAKRRYCSLPCSRAEGERQARRAIELGILRSRSWEEVAAELGYANGRSARMSAWDAATEEERRLLSGRRGKPFTAEQAAVSARNRAAARRQVVRERGGISHAEMEMLLKLAKRCPLCGRAFGGDILGNKEIDHILPLGCGGAHIITNVRVLCKGCNLRRPKDGSDLDQLPFGELVA